MTRTFPIIAALSMNRPDRLQIVRTLLQEGANPDQRGINDWSCSRLILCQGDYRDIEPKEELPMLRMVWPTMWDFPTPPG
jgi:hypothetical protein